jgi:hypothetical protein
MNSASRIMEVAAVLGVRSSAVEMAMGRSMPDRIVAVATLLGQPTSVVRRRAAALDVDTDTALDWLVLAAA